MITVVIENQFSRSMQSKTWYYDCQCWCTDRFGECGTTWDTNLSHGNINFLFENDADATIFALRWA